METFLTTFIRVAAISLMILVGVTARKRGILTENSTKALSSLLIDYICPAAIFSSLVGSYTFREVLRGWVYPVSEILIIAIGFVVGAIAIRFFPKRSRRERCMFHYQCALLNFIFMPMPIVMSMYGERGVAILSLGYVGGELCVWTIGVVAVTGGISLKELKRLFCAPMIAIMLSVVVLLIEEYVPALRPTKGGVFDAFGDGIVNVMRVLGGGTVGISMIVAGSNMANLKFRNVLQPFHLTLAACRLLLIPAICLTALHFMPIPTEGRVICYLIAMMPCSVASVAYSTYFGADSETAATAILTSHIGCLVTVPMWMSIIQ